MNNKIITKNKIAWEEATVYHQIASKELLNTSFLNDNSFSTLNTIEKSFLEKEHIQDKKIAHLCCNNGKDSLSISKMGAELVVGFDFNQPAIKEANDRAKLVNIQNVQYFNTSIESIPDKYNDFFDIIFINVGTLGWFQDTNCFFKIASRILATGGKIFILDIHPISDILNDDRNKNVSPLEVTMPYFDKNPIVNTHGLDYIGGVRYNSNPSYWYKHTLSEVLNTLISNGFNIKSFNEYEEDISKVYPILESSGMHLPLSYTVTAEKYDNNV
ncbi:class I SAM-dependent methyltransferase [Leuconostoc mesenteroides]